ncbi:hypothetical protein [Streptomyces oceani]|uniref:L,D-transpeptidase n=1 Tax=Streptomyces oceani TaxID=1075402 RepID=A0A1E7KHQ9_9ACTN|nr:hypothetical protein [Streptomyces oceani]OEV03502.1 hypothetical protein AN216_11635 [Streptomyces oceani]
MARSSGSAGMIVTVLTALSMGVVSFFAYQASAALDKPSGSDKPSASPSEKESDEKAKQQLPKRSGAGERVVYALERDRVWIVNERRKVERTYRVWPSSVDPKPGTYQVTSRSSHVTGSDGEAIENVVRFASVGPTVIGFSAALDGSKPKLRPGEKTGGVRQRTADGDEMWVFATIGTKVVVTP